MVLTRHRSNHGRRWAVDGRLLPLGLTLSALLSMPAAAMTAALAVMPAGAAPARESGLPPIEREQEVWGAGVTYLRSRDARKAESAVADVYQRVYEATRPEVFFKATGWRVVGNGQPVRIRKDATWSVPEPELTLVINAFGEIVGYTIGNDMSSRDIEGENPLYLPQAKTYNGSCAMGPGIVLCAADAMAGLKVELQIIRAGQIMFSGETSTANMKRSFQELADYLFRETDFPQGTFLMTGTGIVPPESFTLAVSDLIRVTIDGATLENVVE
jgi:2-dehydro-3-deoxy-D-arabinonate dehydratase